MPTLDEIEAHRKSREKIWVAISDYEQRARNFRHDSENFLVVLATVTRDYLDLGVAVIGRYEDDEWQRKLGDTKTKYLKEVNASLTMPFILLKQAEGYVGSHRNWMQYWELYVPKSSKLKNVVSGLLMVADSSATDPMVVHIHHERKWEFQFVGKKGEEFRNEWLRNCKEDAVFRICLGLPPKVI